MAHPQIAAFARLAEGGAKPTRAIAGQNTLITRTIHNMAYDPVRDEIVVPQFYAFAILTFRGDANGDVPPVRKIFGPSTQIKNPSSVALDAVNGEIYVPQGDTVLVFPREADGDVAPIRILKGPDTQLGASHLTIDAVNNLLVASGSPPGGGGGFGGGAGGEPGLGHLLIFNRTASGNAKPLRVIKGPKTMLSGLGLMTNYPPKGHIVIAARGGRGYFVGIWSVFDNGDVPPRWTFGGPNGILKQTRGITLDPKSKSVIVSDKDLNAVLTFEAPEIF